MAQDFEQMLRDVLGDSVDRLSKFQQDQISKLRAKIQEVAREAVKDDIARLTREIEDLKRQVTVLEEERAERGAEGIQPSL